MLMRRALRRGGLILLLVGFPELGDGAEGGGRVLPQIQRERDERGRDPFQRPDAALAARPPGLAGVGVMEAVIRGVVRYQTSPGGPEKAGSSGWAILESPSGEGFVAAPGDRLLDGVLGEIQDGGVIFWFEGDAERPVYRSLALPGAGPKEGR